MHRLMLSSFSKRSRSKTRFLIPQTRLFGSSSNSISFPSPSNPLHVSIVGSGPSAMYTAKYLFKHFNLNVKIDLFETLPAPGGLVRYGVAPDHPEVKLVSNEFEPFFKLSSYRHDPNNLNEINLLNTASNGVNNENEGIYRFRYFGNWTLDQTFSFNEIKRFYHLIIFATGANGDRPLEMKKTEKDKNLKNIFSARHFVNWYNGHPHFQDFHFDFNTEEAIIVGQGNVAMDLARILLTPLQILEKTDISSNALTALAQSKIKKVYLIGRRGPVQAAFTTSEIRELSKLPFIKTLIEPQELLLNPQSNEELSTSKPLNRKFSLLKEISNSTSNDNLDHVAQFKFNLLPYSYYSFKDTDKVGGICFEKATLEGPAFNQQAKGSNEFINIDAGIIFTSIGYRSSKIEGLPFDSKKNVIPSVAGRIALDEQKFVEGAYVVGWLKRGPTGIIGSNINDAKETVNSIISDVEKGLIKNDKENVDNFIKMKMDSLRTNSKEEQNKRFISGSDWLLLDEYEKSMGEKKIAGRPREKILSLEQSLNILNLIKSKSAN